MPGNTRGLTPNQRNASANIGGQTTTGPKVATYNTRLAKF